MSKNAVNILKQEWKEKGLEDEGIIAWCKEMLQTQGWLHAEIIGVGD
jgi:hypothetical protein